MDALGINDRLKSDFRKVNAKDYTTKKQLLDAYISLLSVFPEKQRLKVLKSAIEFSKTDIPTSVANIELLLASLPNFSTDNADFLQTLARFGRKNPRDGRAFIEYVNNHISKFSAEVRRPILTTLVSSYYKYFNLIEKQKEASDLFLEIANGFAPENQVKALSTYYKLYHDKNVDRKRQIANMEKQYKSKLSHAESILYEKKARKATYRALGWKVIGGSVVFIAFVALFLVLLSIERNIKQIRELTAPVES